MSEREERTMRDRIPGEPGFLPGTIWTRVDDLSAGDRVLARHRDGDFWALVLANEPTDDADQRRLHLKRVLNGAPVGTCTLVATASTPYLRLLPTDSPAEAIPATTGAGMAAAAELYGRGWNASRTVPFWLPSPLARQILGARSWEQLCDEHGAPLAWQAPNGDRFEDISDALQHALAAEYVDAPPVFAPTGGHGTTDHAPVSERRR
jgi:hypothetical protein